MKLTLISFSQDVDLSEPNDIKFFLILKDEDGRVIRLPVQKETTEELIRVVYSNKEPEVDRNDEPQTDINSEVLADLKNEISEFEDSSIFGSENIDDELEENEEQYLPPSDSEYASEDEVPSL